MTDQSNTQAAPMQGLSAWLRMMSARVDVNGPDYHALRQWAAEVDAAQPTPEPVALQGRHPLEAYADSYDQMSRMGDGRIGAHSVAVDIRHNMIPATQAARASLPAGDTDLRAAARQVLDAFGTSDASLQALYQALQALPAGGVVGYGKWAEGLPLGTRLMRHDGVPLVYAEPRDGFDVALYTTPQPSETQGRRQMTDDEIKAACSDIYLSDHPRGSHSYDVALARAIEAHHGIKDASCS